MSLFIVYLDFILFGDFGLFLLFCAIYYLWLAYLLYNKVKKNNLHLAHLLVVFGALIVFSA
jgi:hypothetical protein